ncbi:hypothetical protein [Actinoplanes aureus]|uniref:Uncharacterized protein n=1 Tax=Actinoplanes aureus TaxID=2792083 RepID=A0A931CJV8_9ACTN|nr:hypothetical protein [Actinoplanes aureus]MBG0567528.1 hypothetical protein [Actinoplanes aureus]
MADVPTVAPDDSLVCYLDALRVLGSHAVTVQAALLDAHVAADHAARTAALRSLHCQLREMAGIINAALGAHFTAGSPQ